MRAGRSTLALPSPSLAQLSQPSSRRRETTPCQDLAHLCHSPRRCCVPSADATMRAGLCRPGDDRSDSGAATERGGCDGLCRSCDIHRVPLPCCDAAHRWDRKSRCRAVAILPAIETPPFAGAATAVVALATLASRRVPRPAPAGGPGYPRHCNPAAGRPEADLMTGESRFESRSPGNRLTVIIYALIHLDFRFRSHSPKQSQLQTAFSVVRLITPLA